jgi:hypothetical protein
MAHRHPKKTHTSTATDTQIKGGLLSLVRALLHPGERLTIPERQALEAAAPSRPEDVVAVRKLIEAGGDPLGDLLTRSRAPEERRKIGAIYTPPEIVKTMIAWAAAQAAAPERIIDPGAATGRFLLEAGQAFPRAKLVAIDIDPLALLILRANAAVLGLTARLDVYCEDFRYVGLPAFGGRTLFIGNPPYVRHHDIDAEGKCWLTHAATGLGLKASKLAGLHVHFFLRTKQLAQSGDFGAFITSAEWLDVNYGTVVREMLANGLGGISLHVLDPDAMPFDAMTTGAISCFCVGEKPEFFRMGRVESLDQLGTLSDGTEVNWGAVTKSSRWSGLLRGGARPPAHHIELGELFRVHRGQVTGANRVWIAGEYDGQLPESVLAPCITSADELFSAGMELTSATHLRRVIDIPRDLACVCPEDRALVDKFIAWAEEQGANQGYVARHRKPWWSVGLREPAPILCSYMARRTPAFLLNIAQARHINIAHGLYPRQPLPQEVLRSVVGFLRENVGIESGRTYAGGLTKFEPKEVERLIIPRPDYLYAFAQ